MGFISSIPNALIVLIVFGFPVILVSILAAIFGASLVAWIKESTLRVHRRIFCATKHAEFDVQFRPFLFSKDLRDVKSCSAFGDGPVTCDKDCLDK
jgi:hypothetical protein